MSDEGSQNQPALEPINHVLWPVRLMKRHTGTATPNRSEAFFTKPIVAEDDGDPIALG